MKEIDVTKHISIDVALTAITDYLRMLHTDFGIIDDQGMLTIKQMRGCRIEDIPFDQYVDPYPIKESDIASESIIKYPIKIGRINIQNEHELDLLLKFLDIASKYEKVNEE